MSVSALFAMQFALVLVCLELRFGRGFGGSLCSVANISVDFVVVVVFVGTTFLAYKYYI